MENKLSSESEKELIARLRSRIKDNGAEETLGLVLKPNKDTVYADASPIDRSINPEPKNPEPEIDMAKEKKRLKDLCYYHFLYTTIDGKRTGDEVDRAFISELNGHINKNDYLAEESKKILGTINTLDKEDDPLGRIEFMTKFSKDNPNSKEWKDYLGEKFEKDMSIANLNIEENMAGLSNSAPASDELCTNPHPYTGSTIAHVEDYEMINHPKHYNSYDVEVVDMMRRIWGSEKTAIWCELNAFKYRMRMGLKPGSSFDDDLAKEQWYLNKAKEIRG